LAGTGLVDVATTKRILFVAPFGLYRRGTVRYRILPWAMMLAHLKNAHVRVLVAGWDTPEQQGIFSPTQNVELYYLPFPRFFLQWGAIGQVLVWLYMARHAWHVAWQWRPSVVHLSKPVGVPLLFLAFARGRLASCPWPVVLDCDDLESEWRTGVPLARGWRLLGRHVERWAWQKADRVTVASHALLAQVKQARRDERVYHVCNYTPSASPQPVQMTSRRIVIPTRLLDIRPTVLAQWLQSVQQRVPDASLVVLGPTPQQASRLVGVLRSLGVAGVTVISEQPMESYYRFLSSSRLGLYLVENTAAARAKCPQRLLDMILRGVPTIAVDVGEPRYLFQGESSSGEILNLVSPEGKAIAERVAMVWEHQSYLERLQRQGFIAWRAYLQSEKIVDALWRAYFS